MSPHVNGANRLFGGQLMAWIDIAAAVEARRHVKRQVVTAEVDNLEFIGAVYLGETVRLDAQVTWTGRTSIEVRVESYVESFDDGVKDRLINRAYVVFVALDENERPTLIAPFVPETDEEKAEWKEAEKRRTVRLERKSEVRRQK
jgi:acyl-CoA hydrolase